MKAMEKILSVQYQKFLQSTRDGRQGRKFNEAFTCADVFKAEYEFSSS